LVANFVGDLLLLNEEELDRAVSLAIAPGDGLYERAFEKLLVTRKKQRSQLQLLALRLRSRMSFLREPTPLHLFVVTLRCEHSCPYCQVSRRSAERDRFDMSEELALRAVDVALSAPTPRIKVEFQGGEPLLNFELVRKIVGAVHERAPARNKTVALPRTWRCSATRFSHSAKQMTSSSRRLWTVLQISTIAIGRDRAATATSLPLPVFGGHRKFWVALAWAR